MPPEYHGGVHPTIPHVCVVGGGIFGVAGALELARRGRRVTLFEAGPIPHPLAESTDVSKAVRMDYGADDFYTSEMERALELWRDDPFFHESGTMFVSRAPMAPGGFEHDSFETLRARGHALERLDERAIAARSPLRGYVGGYFNPRGGWAESGRVVERLAGLARDAGVTIVTDARVTRVDRGVVLASGERVASDAVVVAAGGWVPALVPEIAACFRTVAQPVFHLAAPDDVRLPVFGADIARTGWYGFPRHPSGFVKIASHGPGRAMPPDSPDRVVTDDDRTRLRDFLRESLPALAAAPIPDAPNVVVATGGSGHAFKFAPLVGGWIARALEGDVVPRFRHRPEIGTRGEERARHRDQ